MSRRLTRRDKDLRCNRRGIYVIEFDFLYKKSLREVEIEINGQSLTIVSESAVRHGSVDRGPVAHSCLENERLAYLEESKMRIRDYVFYIQGRFWKGSNQMRFPQKKRVSEIPRRVKLGNEWLLRAIQLR